MNKKSLTTLLALTSGSTLLFGSGGIFDDYAIVNTGSDAYYNLGVISGNPDFQGASLGTFDVTTDVLELGGQTKTYKNNGTDVTGASIYYRIWSGTESGAFNSLSYAFQIDNVGGTTGDQQWGTDVAGTNGTAFYTGNLLSGLSAGSYTLEVYTEITTNGVDASPTIASNNGGSNYEATFTVVPEPSSYALIGGLLALGATFVRRKVRR